MNWSEFFSQGGYALYVWGSYLAALVLLGGEALVVISCNRKHSALYTQSSETGSSTKHETSS